MLEGLLLLLDDLVRWGLKRRPWGVNDATAEEFRQHGRLMEARLKGRREGGMGVVARPADDPVPSASSTPKKSSAAEYVYLAGLVAPALILLYGPFHPLAPLVVPGWLTGWTVGYMLRGGCFVPFLIGLGVLAVGFGSLALDSDAIAGFAVGLLPGLALFPLISLVRRSRAERQGGP